MTSSLAPPPALSTAGQPRRRALVSGGAGFIGSQLTAHLLRSGAEVIVLDNLSRPGSARRLQWLQDLPQARSLRFVRGDVRNPELALRLTLDRTEIYHLAAQVAVTRAVENPRLDFEVNLAGSFNLLEGARLSPRLQLFLFTSTNKVYGGMGGLAPTAACSESQRLDFHSPYGCSKGGADQYVRDYFRVYGVPAVVFRMSCIYGPHQSGTEDQGWVAHFAAAAVSERPLTIFGDGHQVRDLLFVDDLIAAIDAAWRHRRRLAGEVFNIGGGAANARSLLEIIAELEALSGRRLVLRHAPWRLGDQRRYVSDTSRFASLTGWRPQASVSTGIQRLYQWLADHRDQWEECLPEAMPLAS